MKQSLLLLAPKGVSNTFGHILGAVHFLTLSMTIENSYSVFKLLLGFDSFRLSPIILMVNKF